MKQIANKEQLNNLQLFRKVTN